MKSVLISIQPKWCELIASGKKILEVRKTRPNIKTPFKCYIYCTLSGSNEFFKEDCSGDIAEWNRSKMASKKGKVIGEFVCNEIVGLCNVATDNWKCLTGNMHEQHKNIVTKKACLTENELHKYAHGRQCYAWHISNLIIYDKPKELKEFKSWIPKKFCKYRNDHSECCGHHFIDCEYMKKDLNSDGSINNFLCDKRVTRPPQSWCYVEGVSENA